MGANFGMFLNLDNFDEDPTASENDTQSEKQKILSASLRENKKTTCHLCYLHTLLDLDPSLGLYRFIKLHNAIKAYFTFLSDEGKLNKSKAIVN